MNIIFLGDIVGSSGRMAVRRYLPDIRREMEADLVIANGENAAHGFGLTTQTAREIFDAGVDFITGGNHTWDKKEVVDTFREFENKIIRPANYPDDNPGKGFAMIRTANDHHVGIINLMGRVFMDPLDCPFRCFDRHYEKLREQSNILFLDFHAEATSEKIAMAYHVDGRISAMVGTHTHVQTADERIFPKGTGYLTDAGMTGPLDSVIGMKKEMILQRFLEKRPIRIEVADGPAILQGVCFRIDSNSGKCESIRRIQKSDAQS
ncbi:MAG: TIGR00282 family metallophosphoesterase [Deltaproteobacteria bacterium CG11_big_fil_rev_8_21_14_0_20_45_16]|nr:MAG: TIGR00282 family metallophosphoesterase [Deltaproteobacteria bacterium CG11_big_fil_rev_8_21_14_0_20_45_16]